MSLLQSFGVGILEIQDLFLSIKTSAYKFLHCNTTPCCNRNTCRQSGVSCNLERETALGSCLQSTQFWTHTQPRESPASWADSVRWVCFSISGTIEWFIVRRQRVKQETISDTEVRADLKRSGDGFCGKYHYHHGAHKAKTSSDLHFFSAVWISWPLKGWVYQASDLVNFTKVLHPGVGPARLSHSVKI